MSFLPKIRYDSIDVLFDKPPSSFSASPVQVKLEKQSASGKIETINFHRRWKIKLSRLRSSANLQNQLEAFWDYVRGGDTFSFWRDRDLAGYWNFEGNSLKSNDEYSPLTQSGTMAFPTGKYGNGLNITNQTVYYTASNFFNSSPTQGSISFWFAPNFVVSSNSTNHTLFYIDGSVDDWSIRIRWTTSNDIEVNIQNSSGNTAIAAGAPVGSFLQNEFHHYTITWDTTIADGAKIYVDGVLDTQSSNSSFTVEPIGTNFRIGYDGSVYANGIFDDVEVRRDVLDDSTIRARFQNNKALGWRRNYWPTLMIDQDAYDPRVLQGLWTFDVDLNFKEVL